MYTNFLLKFVAKFPHKTLLNLSASKANQNVYKILTKICSQIYAEILTDFVLI